MGYNGHGCSLTLQNWNSYGLTPLSEYQKASFLIHDSNRLILVSGNKKGSQVNRPLDWCTNKWNMFSLLQTFPKFLNRSHFTRSYQVSIVRLNRIKDLNQQNSSFVFMPVFMMLPFRNILMKCLPEGIYGREKWKVAGKISTVWFLETVIIHRTLETKGNTKLECLTRASQKVKEKVRTFKPARNAFY